MGRFWFYFCQTLGGGYITRLPLPAAPQDSEARNTYTLTKNRYAQHKLPPHPRLHGLGTLRAFKSFQTNFTNHGIIRYVILGSPKMAYLKMSFNGTFQLSQFILCSKSGLRADQTVAESGAPGPLISKGILKSPRYEQDLFLRKALYLQDIWTFQLYWDCTLVAVFRWLKNF